MRLGFIGFGAAAYGLAKGLRESAAGELEIGFFDSQSDTPGPNRVIRNRAAETGAGECDDLKELILNTEVVVSCVTAAAALTVAEQAAAQLGPHQLYLDVNTASPETMRKVGRTMQRSSVPFVDVAMMGGIPTFLHRVPCLASGSGAESFRQRFVPYGMDITVVGNEPGQASAIKLFRSIFMKGFLALLIETLSATHRYGVDAVVLESIARTMDKNDFLETVRLQLGKGVISAERMNHEMETVVQTLAELGTPALMSAAARDTLRWCSELDLAAHFNHEIPDSLEKILEALIQKSWK